MTEPRTSPLGWHHQARRLAVIAGVVFSSVGLMCPPAMQPPPGACGNASNYFDAWIDSEPGIEGASATIAPQDAPLCTSDTSSGNTISVWSMVHPQNGQGWAQSGPYKSAAMSSFVHFAQQSPDHNTWSTVFGSTVSLGEQHHYWQQYDSGCHCVHSNVDTTRFLDSPWDPKTTWASPFNASFAGENAYAESDMPGTASTPTSFTGIEFQFTGTDGWLSPSCGSWGSTNQNTTRWSQSSVTTSPCNSFNIWHN